MLLVGGGGGSPFRTGCRVAPPRRRPTNHRLPGTTSRRHWSRSRTSKHAPVRNRFSTCRRRLEWRRDYASRRSRYTESSIRALASRFGDSSTFSTRSDVEESLVDDRAACEPTITT